MKIATKSFVVVVLPLLIILGFCNNIYKEPKTVLVDGVVAVMQSQHYKPLEIDDSFSNRVFTLFIDQLDERGLFFTEKDLNHFDKYRFAIDDEVKSKKFNSFDDITTVYKKRIDEAKKYSSKTFTKDIDLDKGTEFTLPDEKRDPSKSPKELEEYWTNYNSFLVLDNYVRKLIAQDNSINGKDTSYVVISKDTLAVRAVTEIAKNQKEWFKRLTRLKDKDYFDMFVNCIAAAYDPHSNYYPPQQKEDFDIRLSGQFEGIGASLSEREGYIKVENIIPGSASYRQGELKAGDLIIAVAQGDKEEISVIDMPLSDVVQLIRGEKGTIVNLTIKKPDGTKSVIPIKRDVVVLEEGYAKSALVLSGEDKMGYIYLPSFYADFNRKGGRSCSEDMAKEVLKLKEDNVKGIIIDLRYNGGGSLSDVVEMVGIFTGKGPAVQIKSKTGNADVYQSHSPTALYDGPLVILTNYYSASASEILAAALQDYKRAIIVGTKHTFGKGTVQRFMDLGSIFKSGNDEGSVKLTTQKFYRVNGGTTQFEGVQPDVVIPDRFDFTKLGERELPYALINDKLTSVIPTTSYTEKMQNAIDAANTSVTNNPFLQNQEKLAKAINEQSMMSTYTLSTNAYKTYLEGLNKKQQELDSIKPNFNLVLEVLSADKRELSSDTTKMKIRNEWVGKYKQDAYIYESLKILSNLN